MLHGRFLWALLLLSPLAVTALVTGQTSKPAPARAEAPDDKDKTDAEDEKDRAIAERFRRVLEGNPRRGTALDRLYGYHVERGTLDQLVEEYAARTRKDSKDGVAWMIVGLIESQRGRDGAAVAAFKQAETNLPDNAMPAYYLGQSLILVGQPDAAAEAFERSIARKSNRNELLDAFQALGRVYQRSQRVDKALEVWNRLEKLFPDDARVQEQIAATMVEENQFDQALPRLTKLADQTEDKYRQTTLRMDAADLKVKLKKTPEALADFEKLLSDLEKDSWLNRDVRRRIEEIFLRNDDLAGLAKYYQSWLEKNPTDVDAIARLSKNLAAQGRAPEAREWLRKGVTAAPKHRALRQALIDQYVFEQNFTAAATEYEALDKADPNNPDTLRDWGRLIMRDVSKPEPERRAAATAIWRRLLERKPNDPTTASQTADLMRTAGAADDAIALYKKAIDLAPNAAQYREYLGEYYHSLKQSEEALATWRPIAEGANRNAKNLARLAEVFAGFGYRKEALAALADAISLDNNDFNLYMTYGTLLHDEGKHKEALEQFTTAVKLISNPEEAEQVLVAEIKVYQAAETLGDQIDGLQGELDAGKDATADRWLRLARYYEANRQIDKAAEIVAKAQAKDSKSITALIAAARIFEASGMLMAAIDANRKLAVLDRRFKTEYLTAVTKLEQRLGRREQALQAGRDLLAASPGNPEVYKFFADLCFQLGDQEEGLEALRRSVRANPSDPQGLITLANALGERVRQGEAIELFWRALEHTNELDAKLGIIERLAQLYLENNQFDKLLERLERERREADKTREATFGVAQAYTTAGDLGSARLQLERLLTENTRDTHLLGQLSTLCEQEGDLAAALKYQRQLNLVAPANFDHQLRLAQLLTRTGEADEAADIWVRLVSKDTEPHRNLSAIDQLLTANKHETALAILSRMLVQKPGNWELLYREGAALAAKDKMDEAATRFQALLALRLSDDELGEIAKHEIAQAKKKTPPKPGQPTTAAVATAASRAATMASRYEEWSNPPLTRRTGNLHRIRMAIGMNSEYYYGGGVVQPVYVPADFGEARLACLGWLYEIARGKGTAEAFAKQMRDAKDKAGAELRPLWDWYYLQTIRNEGKQVLPAAQALLKTSDPAGLLAYVTAVTSRTNTTSYRARRVSNDDKDFTPPLPADQLDQLMKAFAKLKQLKPDWATGNLAQTILTELKRAGRTDEGNAVYKAMLKDAQVVSKVQAAMTVSAQRNDLEGTLELFGRLEKLQPPVKTSATLAQLPTRQVHNTLAVLMGKRADDKRFEDVRNVLEHYLATARRQNLTAVRSSSSRRTPPRGGFAAPIYVRGRSTYAGQTQVSYPSPNDYYDQGMLGLLYNAFDLHKKADLSSDLVSWLRTRLEAARGAEQLYWQLALGYLHWWAGDKDEAVAELQKAVQAAPNDHNLILEVSSLRELNNDFSEAAALLDSFTPLDMPTMQRREEAAMRLAERTGDLDRARQAADRLFGLRLDADKQLELAGKMHRLGMHAMAETVLSRAQRQAGNKNATLVRLMTQYQSQNQVDLAVQIARQILRKGTAGFNPMRGYDESSGYRNQAINVLARSGQIKDMIERAEAQLKASPKSTQIQQALIDYYRAANDKKKLKDALVKLAEQKPTDGKARIDAAQQLQQLGERDAAIEQYKIGIKLNPALFGDNYWQIQQLFTEANRFEELATVLDEIDMRKVGAYYRISEPVMALLQQPKGKTLGLKLFRKAWEAYPQQRSYLLARMYNDEIWRLPEMYTFAKEAVIPREESDMDPWQSATDITSYGQKGRVDAVLTRLMTITRKQQRLPELRAEAAAALEKRPDWIAGKMLVAILDIQSGNKEQGKKAWQEVVNDPKADIPPLARFILCQELEFYAGVEDVAIKTLEGGIEEMMRDGNYDLSYSPARRLIWWYQLLGRKDDAKKLLHRFATTEQVDPGYAGGYWQYRQAQNGITLANELVRLGETVEAVKIFNRLLGDRELLDQANAYYGGERFDQQCEQGLRNAVKALKPSALPDAVSALLTPREATAGDKAAIDLVLLVESRDLTKATLNSLYASAIKSSAKKPDILKDARVKLAELLKKHPTDHGVLTAHVLAVFANGKAEEIKAALDQLVKVVDATPLEALPANGKANARQRAEARLQVPLWLVARECLAKGREELWPTGEKLAQRAAAAAKRQQDVLLTSAIFREWGQLELDRGNKSRAAATWTELLDWTLPKPAPKPEAARKPTLTPVAPAAPAPPVAPAAPAAPMKTTHVSPLSTLAAAILIGQVAAPALKTRATPAAGRANAVAPTEEQFRRAYEIALVTAEKDLPEVSLKAMREAVRGGPPVAPVNRGRGGGGYTQRTINGVQYLVEMGYERQTSVDQALVTLVPKWQAKKVPASQIYEVLAAAVLPEARPTEVFLYTSNPIRGSVYIMSASGSWTPTTDPIEDDIVDRGLGNSLVRLAVEADKVADLRARLEARSKQPLGELSAKILLAMLGIQARDEAVVGEAVRALGDRLKKDSLHTTNIAVTGALAPLLSDAKFGELLIPIIAKAAENQATSGNIQQAAELRYKLAQYYLKRNDVAAARAQYKLAEEAGKKTGPGGFDVHAGLAQQYVKAGWIEDALRELGFHADHSDAAPKGYRYGEVQRPEPAMSSNYQFARLVLLLLELPAAKRYEALKAWSLPTSGRKSIRYYVGLTPRDLPPEAFGKRPPYPLNQPVSTMLLLIDAAKEAGKIDELTAEAKKLASEKVENANLFAVLAYLAQGKGKENEADVKAYADAAHKRLTEKPELPLGTRYYGEYRPPVPFFPSELIFATLCLADPKVAAFGENLLNPLMGVVHNRNPYTGDTANTSFVTYLQALKDRIAATNAGAPNALAAALPPRWQTATSRAIWLGQEGYLLQASSDQASELLFDTPLAGSFEFSVDAYGGAGGYAGLFFSPMNSSIAAVGNKDIVHRQVEPSEGSPFRRLTVQVEPGKVRCLVDGKLWYEDAAAAPTSPWIMLGGANRPVFRNLSIAGKPEVPAEIKLTAGDYLEGWMTHIYSGRVPGRLSAKERASGMGRNQWGQPLEDNRNEEREYDWQVKGGEILGRKLNRVAERPVPSKLAYFRPLQPGETIRYEFFHEPGKTHVHPSLGRLAFLLEPDGVRLHWLTDEAGDDWTGLKVDNAIDAPDARRSKQVNLKAGDWNAVALAGTSDGVRINVNGVTVYEMKLETTSERLFGFFHYRERTAARVRNVILTGTWSAVLGVPAEGWLATKPSTPAEAKARRAILGETYYATEAGDLVEKARKLSPAERYNSLANWVLPTERRPLFQLAGAIKPQDVLSASFNSPGGTTGVALAGRRVLLGGRLEAPSLELIAAAKEAGKLDDLLVRLAELKKAAADELDRRSCLALEMAALAAQGKDEEVAERLRALLPSAEKRKLDAPPLERWPDLIAAHAALGRPALLEPLTKLAQGVNKNLEQAIEQKTTFAEIDWWVRAFRDLQAQTTLQRIPDSKAWTSDRFVHWTSVPGVSAASRGQGHGVPHWLLREGTLVHLPGHGEDYLYLNTPLRGDFEVTCELSSNELQAVHVRYGAHEFELGKDRKYYKLHSSAIRNGAESMILPPLPPAKDDKYQLRLQVKDGWLKAYVDGRELVAEKIGTNPDPWLMLHCSAKNSGVVRNLKIMGQPTVPDQIDLLAGSDLGMWASYDGTGVMSQSIRSFDGNTGSWSKRGEEMHHFGKKPDPPEEGDPVRPRHRSEAAVFYQRPLLEDGVVEYEFFYDPEAAHVSPALDRLVFMLEPNGVKLHWLTDGAYDKSKVAFDNTVDEPSSRRGPSRLPLSPKAWNKVRLAVAGDIVKVALNGTEVYERSVEPTNQRTFGFFHYTDRTEARVRSVLHRGAWAKQRPENERLFDVKPENNP